MVVTWGLWFLLLDPAGSLVPLKRILVPLVWGGQDTNVGFAKCNVPVSGVYTLTATKVPKSSRPMYVLVCKPFRNIAAVWLLVLVFSAALAAGSLALGVTIGR